MEPLSIIDAWYYSTAYYILFLFLCWGTTLYYVGSSQQKILHAEGSPMQGAALVLAIALSFYLGLRPPSGSFGDMNMYIHSYVNVINSPSNGIYIIQNGHVLQTWQTEKEASCGEDGMMVSTCSRCGKKIEKVIPAQGNHELSGWGVLKAPTCLEEGLKGRICKKCHKVFDQQSIPCTGHSFGGWKLKKKATTRSEGSVERICQICHQVETRKIPVKAK